MKKTKEELLLLGVAYIEKHKCYPSSKKWTIKSAGCSRDRIYEVYNSWIPFIEELREYTEVDNLSKKWSKESIIAALHSSAKANNGQPSYKDFRASNTYPSIPTIIKYFGSWVVLLNAGKYKKEITKYKTYILVDALTYCFNKSGYFIPKICPRKGKMSKEAISWAKNIIKAL